MKKLPNYPLVIESCNAYESRKLLDFFLLIIEQKFWIWMISFTQVWNMKTGWLPVGTVNKGRVCTNESHEIINCMKDKYGFYYLIGEIIAYLMPNWN